MRCAGGSFRASSEVDDMEWLALDEARLCLTSAFDRAVLDRFARTTRDSELLLVLVRRGATASPGGRLKGRPEAQRLNRSGRAMRKSSGRAGGATVVWIVS